jgi:hypothetical protein
MRRCEAELSVGREQGEIHVTATHAHPWGIDFRLRRITLPLLRDLASDDTSPMEWVAEEVTS